MGKKLRWLLIVCITLPVLAVDNPSAPRRVSVEQLERLLSSPKEKSDVAVAKELSALALSERLSAARFDQLKTRLPGEKSREALLAVADQSAFLQPPGTEIPATARPDMASQKRMMAHTVSYLAKTLPLLPNLFATRDTTRFENRPSGFEAVSSAENPLRIANRSVLTVFYRDGQEFVDVGPIKNSKSRTPDKGLTTWGEFGPILGTIVMDAAQSQLSWSHWELSGAGPLAVFSYSVPKAKSHYNVRFCCTTSSYGLEVNFLTQRVGYHGEIALDPESGTILRLTLVGDLDPQDPIRQASLIVEYGPEEIGGKTYICPVHGIALASAPDLKALDHSLAALAQIQNARAKVEGMPLQETSLTTLSQEPKQVLLNDVSFGQYHLFRTEARMFAGKAAEQSAASAAIAPPPSQPDTSSDNVIPAEEAARIPIPTTAPAQPAAGALVLEPVTTPAAAAIPEIYVARSNGLPDAPAIQSAGASDAGSTFRINARQVDVSLVALDKKGRPLTNVNPDDLEVYDNGVKVDMRSFSQAGASAPAQPDPTGSSAETRPGFSNRNPVSGKPTPGDLQNTIVLLLDNTLSFDDLQNAREQMGRFLKELRENERASIYVMRRTGFQILQDTTTDHQLLAKTLAGWTAAADNIALGQEQEARNRQQMEYVRNTEDLVSVNGNGLTDNQAQTQALDPQLRELGDNPGRDALSNLVLLGRHLAGVPGHKSLVWIASDNVLADWTHANMNIDKGSRYIDPTALRAQEAMNEAHVSVYPLDASRLEAGGLDASVASTNVLLNPTAIANQLSGVPGGGCGVVTSGSPAGQAGGPSPELTSGADINTCTKNLDPGRLKSQMQQDLHSIQGVYREIADATGGRPFRRASDIVGELNAVASDGRATYLISFSPPQAADDKYHQITVKLAGRKDVMLRYRSGYFYRQEPTTIKDRFREAVSQPEEMTEIGLKANFFPAANNRTVKLQIAATDLEIAQNDAFWTDKVDVYVVQREIAGPRARVSGQSIDLHLLPGSYQKYLKDGIPFDQPLEIAPDTGSLRIIVLDENSGRMGSVTIPVTALAKQS